MTIKEHRYFGLSFSITVGVLFNFPMITSFLVKPVDSILFFLFVLLGSGFPDIDHPTSTMGKATAPISRLINKTFGHRTLTHSIVGVCMMSYASYWLIGHSPELWVGFMLGVVSHVLGDLLSPMGCQLFWPMTKMWKISERTLKPKYWIATMVLLGIFAINALLQYAS